MQTCRDPRHPGATAQSVHFTFDGVRYAGVAGDTLASALLANGVHLVGRSFKYHRPRGILSAGAEEPNALVTLKQGPGRITPNVRATEVALIEGLTAESQNNWPSLGQDVGAIGDFAGKALSSGFYYKTFMGPKSTGITGWSRLFEPLIRRAAGLGPAPTEPDPDQYASFFDHCDVLICGGGPAGIAAALAAGRIGKDVILCDEQAAFGGSLLHETTAVIDGQPAQRWLAQALAALRSLPNVRMLKQTQAFGYFAQNFVALNERVGDGNGPVRERMWQVRAGEVVLATGAIERPLVFPGNDRPGVMLAEAARIYLNRYGVRVGSRVVVIAAHDSAYRAALDLAAAGVNIAAIADVRATPQGELAAMARDAGLRIITDATIADTRGRLRVKAVGVSHGGSAPEWIGCDALLMSGGWTPSVHLYSQSRGKVVWLPERQMFLPGKAVQDQRSAGACNGTFGVAAVLAEGTRAGAAAAGVDRNAIFDVENDPAQDGGWLGELPAVTGGRGKAFVDFQNDVKADDIGQAVQEGFRSIEHVKRYTTTGMATDQGKTSNLNALAIAAQRLGKTIPEVGLTTFRQPYTPVTFGVFAHGNRGMLFEPERRTALHELLAAEGAAFEDVGMWKRAHYFARAGETMHRAVARECRKVRLNVGVFDASTLGKIEVVGPDAARFLDRIYTNPVAKLAVGRCRYGLMLNEQGFVMDDGVIARLATDRFHVTTTTGGAARVLAHMEDYLQTEWPDLKCWLTSVTEHWAVIAVQGPKARQIIGPLVGGVDISNAAMPHMSARDGTICGVPMRLMRVSFTGELGFEVNVPAGLVGPVFEVIRAAAQAVDGVLYGTEAMHVLRAEKGYIIVGQETDGTVTPDDLGLSWAVSKVKPDFVGKRSLSRPDMVAKGRKQLVGLLMTDPAAHAEEGAQITDLPTPAKGTPALGHVTSAYFSPALNRNIALALVADGRSRMGQTLFLPMEAGPVAVTIVDPVFHDREGARLHV